MGKGHFIRTPKRVHAYHHTMREHTLCFWESRVGTWSASTEAEKTDNPDSVECQKCIAIMRRTSLYNAMKARYQNEQAKKESA